MEQEAKSAFRELLLTIAKSAKSLHPLLKDVPVSEINGEAKSFEDVMLLVNPQDGQVAFWNINALWDRTINDFRTMERETNLRRRELIELDTEIQKRRELLADYQSRMPKMRGGFEVN